MASSEIFLWIPKFQVGSREKFDNIVTVEYETKCLGDLDLHTKFSVVKNLKELDMKIEQEIAYTKVRMGLREREERAEDREMDMEMNAEEMKAKEMLSKIQDLKAGPPREAQEAQDKTKVLTEEEREEMLEEEEARTRQIYDPSKKEYDDRNRRVTDLKECSRVTLPKPLDVKHEAAIEMRRENHLKIFNDYVREHCGKNGEQKSNLSEEERDGLERLTKRRDEKGAVIMKTDKSGKFTVATVEKYIEMGHSHIGDDKEITREKIREIERILNGHCAAWGKMFGSGEKHDHLFRIIKSKCVKSTQVSNLYMMHKDHKKEPEKGRAVATAISSNTTGLSNAVSDYVESLANSMEDPVEVISTEDMLNRIEMHNAEVMEMRKEFEEARKEKMKCTRCKITEMRCKTCEEKGAWHSTCRHPKKVEEMTCRVPKMQGGEKPYRSPPVEVEEMTHKTDLQACKPTEPANKDMTAKQSKNGLSLANNTMKNCDKTVLTNGGNSETVLTNGRSGETVLTNGGNSETETVLTNGGNSETVLTNGRNIETVLTNGGELSVAVGGEVTAGVDNNNTRHSEYHPTETSQMSEEITCRVPNQPAKYFPIFKRNENMVGTREYPTKSSNKVPESIV